MSTPWKQLVLAAAVVAAPAAHAKTPAPAKEAKPAEKAPAAKAAEAKPAEPPHVHPGGDDSKSAVPMNQNHPVDPNVAKPTGTNIELKLKAGTAIAYVAKPQGEPKGALLVFHEWWGLNDHIKATADAYAKQGFYALAVDVYGGKVATTKDEAGKLMGGLDQAHAQEVAGAGFAHLAEAAKGKKVATIGWCMGGGLSLQASLANPERTAATVIYYGMPETDVAKLKKLKGPVLGIWGTKDGWINGEKVDGFEKAMKEAGAKYEGKRFEADHAFANPTGGAFNPAAAKEADALTAAFLAANLK